MNSISKTSIKMPPAKKSTVVKEEKEFFEKLSSSWWENSELVLLKDASVLLEPYYSKKILQHFPDSSVESLRILEVGCGGGFLTERLARSGFNITAIDINEEVLEVAKNHGDDITSTKIDYLFEPVEEHCKQHFQKYDVVISDYVLEHVTDHDLFIKCCSDCVKPNGLLFMTAMSKTFLGWLGGILILENVLNLLPRGIHDYNKCISAPDTERIMKSYGFEIRETKGIICNILTKSVRFFPTNTFSYVVCSERKSK